MSMNGDVLRYVFYLPVVNHGHDGGAGSNDNDTDSAWVDVLTPWAGEGYGARFLPRIGEVVVLISLTAILTVHL